MDKKVLKLGRTMIEIPIEPKFSVDHEANEFKISLKHIKLLASDYIENEPKNQKGRDKVIELLKTMVDELYYEG